MTLNPQPEIEGENINDLEKAKFREHPAASDNISVAVIVENDNTNPVNIEGEFQPSGLRTSILVTNTTVGTSAAKLPATPLTTRNSMVVYNKSTTDTIYIGGASVTTSGANEGWEIDPGSYFSIDITDSIEIYAISTATVNVKIMELA